MDTNGTTTTNQTDALADMPANARKKAEPVVLRGPHDYNLVTAALTRTIDELTKLQKKNAEEGYPELAKKVAADIAAIQQIILPQFRMQREFPLVDAEQFEKAIKGALQPMVYRAFETLDDSKVKHTKDAIHRRRDRLVDEIANRVTLYARDVAEHSFTFGIQARQTSADVLANARIATLSGRAD